MLLRETLIANEALSGLTDEQISAIETLSRNDEDAVIGARFGEVYRQMDATIEKATGIKRNGDEKTYNYLERAATEFASKYSDYDTLKSTISDLEAKIAKGGDDALKTQLSSVTAELNTTKEQFNTLKASFDVEKQKHAKALLDYQIDNEIAKAKDGITFKAGLNEFSKNTLVSQAVANLKAKNPYFEDKDGVSTLLFHDENGGILNNPENKLNPYTAKELLMKELENFDIIEKKKPTKGAGGEPIEPKQTLSGATTRAEAYTMIGKILSERGIAKTSLSYQTEFDKLCDEYEVSKLK